MKKNKIILIVLWCINILALIMAIVWPKNNTIYNASYYVFNVGIFLVPVLLMLYEIATFNKDKTFNACWIQGIGAIALIALSMIRFMGTVLKEALPMLITIFIVCIALEVLLIYFSRKDISNKKHIWLLIGAVSIIFLYFSLAMIVSYDFSGAW